VLEADLEVSALKYSGRGGFHGRSPLLRLQSDERLVTMIRRGNSAAFEQLLSRYQTRLLSFCRHLLGSREDAEDVLQEVLAAAYNAMLADQRPINVRPWLYRIARNRCLNHLRRARAIGVDSMDVHFSDNGASTADKVHDREEFRQLVGDIHGLPETQRTALVLREMDALSYEQIAEAMETTVPSVKSLLVRARVSLAEASTARQLSCEEVRVELGEAAEGLVKKPSAAVRRHVKSCSRCEIFDKEMKRSSKALAALMPFGAVGALRQLLFIHLGHSAGSSAAGAAAGAAGAGAGAGATGAGAAGATVAGAGAAGAAGGAGSAGIISAGIGAVATKAAAGLAAAALVTAGTVAVSQSAHRHAHHLSGLQVLTTAVNAGVERSAASAPRMADPVKTFPTPKRHHAAAKTRHVATSTNRSASTLATKVATLTASTTTTTITPTIAPTTPNTQPVPGPTATTAAVTTTPAETTTVPTATTATTTTPTNSTTTTTTTPTSTTSQTTTTPTTTAPSPPTGTGGSGIVPNPPVTTSPAIPSTPGS
jgi:RNA polymerase sigma factor (sigma-70 family)